MKLSIPESKLNSEGWEGKGRSGWERKRENWMGKCLGEKELNKKAASGIYGLEIRYSPRMDCESTAAYKLKKPHWAQDYFLPFLSSEPMVMHITLYTLIIITTIIHKLNHSG